MDNFLKKIKEKNSEKKLTLDSVHHILMKEYGYIPFKEIAGDITHTTYYFLGYKLPFESKTETIPQLQISTIISLIKHIGKDGEELKKQMEKHG